MSREAIINKIMKQMNLGTENESDKFEIKRIQLLNFITYLTYLYYVFPIIYYIQKSQTDQIISIVIVISLVFINHIIFRITNNIDICSYVYCILITVRFGHLLIATGNTTISAICTAIVIIIVMNILNIKKGIPFIITIFLTHIFVLLYNVIKTGSFTSDHYLTTANITALFFVYIFSHNQLLLKNKLFSELDKEKEKRKRLFINIVHDLKSPLSIIHNNADMCSKQYPNIESIQKMKENVVNMEKNILKILKLERLEKEIVIDKDSVSNLTSITTEISSLYKSYINSQDIKIEIDIQDDIYGQIDQSSFIKIMNNLLDNAIKHTKFNGKIYIRLHRCNNKANLTIEDTGIGIPESEYKKIFNSYYQVDNGVSNRYGLGIGLTLVKKICEAYNSEVTVKSTLGSGSSFIIQIPLGNRENVSYPQIYNEDYYISHNSNVLTNHEYNNDLKTILIVEDNYDILNYLISNFSKSYNILSATNGEEALNECYLDKKIDLIITDIIMPVMDGYEFIEELRTKKKYKNIPVIFLTAKPETNLSQEFLSLGAIDYISKPFSIEILTFKVKSILSLISYERESLIFNISDKLNDFVYQRLNNSERYPQRAITLNDEIYNEYSITKKEKEIIEEISKGYSQKNIAERLNISVNTVKSHLHRIYRKCNVQNSTSLLKLFRY